LDRNEIPLEKGMTLWNEYNGRLLSLLEEFQFPLVCFDTTRNDYIKAVQAGFERLSLKPSANGFSFFAERLRVQSYEEEKVPPEIQGTYLNLFKAYAHQFD